MAIQFWRFLSKRFTKNKAPLVIDEKRRHKSDLECIIVHLDDEEFLFYIPKDAKASQVYDAFYAYIGLNQDQDYFGLKNSDNNWIDPLHKLRKQVNDGSKIKIYLRIKFFSSDPHNIYDELARYLFTLQLRQDMVLGKLPCPDLYFAAELAAILLQAWAGNYNPSEHTHAFVSSHRFLPDEFQTKEFYSIVLDEYQKLAYRNLVPADADKLYLDKIRRLPGYGTDWHPVKGTTKETKDTKYLLGLTPSCILVKESGQNQHIGEFQWTAIENLIMQRSKLKIIANAIDENTKSVEQLKFVFQLPNTTKCKQLWQSCCEYHTFFQLSKKIEQPKPKQGFFRLRSKFYATFRTEYQMYQHQSSSFGSSSFRRTHSLQKGLSASSLNKTNNELARSASTSSVRRIPSRKLSTRIVPTGGSRETQVNQSRPSYHTNTIHKDSQENYKQTHKLSAQQGYDNNSPIHLETSRITPSRNCYRDAPPPPSPRNNINVHPLPPPTPKQNPRTSLRQKNNN